MGEPGSTEFTSKPTSKESVFSIVGSKDHDSSGTENWKNFLDSSNLTEAWKPPQGSFFERFSKTKLIESINKIGSLIKPRYSEGEITSENEIKKLIENGILGKGTAVFLDSGGAHSVAMAATLAERGYQPVVMFNNTPHEKGSTRPEQSLATLLYFAEKMKKLKASGTVKSDSPPVFVMDCHRDDGPIGNEKDKVNNSYSYKSSDFPSAKELIQHGITKIVYLNEGDQHAQINASFQSTDRLISDLKPIVAQYEKSGIKMFYTGISPWGSSRSRMSDFHFNDRKF
jgi:hypothetical protein